MMTVKSFTTKVPVIQSCRAQTCTQMLDYWGNDSQSHTLKLIKVLYARTHKIESNKGLCSGRIQPNNVRLG